MLKILAKIDSTNLFTGCVIYENRFLEFEKYALRSANCGSVKQFLSCLAQEYKGTKIECADVLKACLQDIDLVSTFSENLTLSSYTYICTLQQVQGPQNVRRCLMIPTVAVDFTTGQSWTATIDTSPVDSLEVGAEYFFENTEIGNGRIRINMQEQSISHRYHCVRLWD